MRILTTVDFESKPVAYFVVDLFCSLKAVTHLKTVQMSDDEEVSYKAKKVVHYGSLEESERVRLADEEMESQDASPPPDDQDAEKLPATKETVAAKAHVYTSNGIYVMTLSPERVAMLNSLCSCLVSQSTLPWKSTSPRTSRPLSRKSNGGRGPE